ncbi:MAG: ABC transporter [Herpetosiphonaceae bacterium]|nr:MAG: ABC transporter [Herpetosiphonaceae bacterium]
MIVADNLHKTFGDFQAVKGISLEVAPGEVLALLGPNGAGKTTTVRMLSAILKPTSGQATVGGFDVVREARQVRHAVGLLTEFPGLYHRMRAFDYLLFFGRLQGVDDQTCMARAERLLRKFDLWEARDKRLDGYSKGMKQKIALIRAMIHEPRILFLDEPTTAMDPHSARTVRDAIAELREDRRTIILCTHNLTEAETLADRIAIIRDGSIIAEGDIAGLSRQLLGDPLWEVRLAHPLPQLAEILSGVVNIKEVGQSWARYTTPDPVAANPMVVERLTAARSAVVSLAEVQRSLEDVYLSIIGQGAPERIAGVDFVEEYSGELVEGDRRNGQVGQRTGRSP